ncbi:HlyD family type I secretion periplasmic adaptor subunit [Rhizobium sp. P32RR-XVIII]|uniref:HlyD family type I secretion periplasmic adaptor subunit n=1 Tax=Rhizobium sp. P32RR-XVIII TaxID=2726738 RepID=UPI00145702A5|nr:HlyD family type I secretion periplasmic adaptor subunit [Rhizobium sp. P32RR-XVIII]NLS03924.1 HlyD family type I secretion periplasmic adaptor subunit [Rhizobium sp. P32RR-XVIII]
MSVNPAPASEAAIKRLTTIALAMVLLLVGVVGGLGATTYLSGAVIATGTLVVDSYVKPVQHQKGGTVGKIFVKNGSRVDAGQILVHLDDTQLRSNLAIISQRLIELSATAARLRAEQDGDDEIKFPTNLLQESADAASDTIAGERRLFEDRRTSRTSRKAQLRERIKQLRQEADGLMAQQTGKKAEMALIDKELESVNRLLARGMVEINRLYELQRESARLTGELGSLVASLAETNGKVAETELQIIQIDDDQRSEVSEQLRKTQSDISEFAERLAAAKDELQRVDIRAPQAGVVHELAVHATGAVVAPGEAILQIVPARDMLTPQVRVSPQDIDQVSVGQQVILRFSAFNQRSTPEINGVVEQVAADVTTDKQTGAAYYVVRISVPENEWKRLADLVPIPGMPVEAFVQTGARTALAYLTKPLTDQVARAFREE